MADKESCLYQGSNVFVGQMVTDGVDIEFINKLRDALRGKGLPVKECGSSLAEVVKNGEAFVMIGCSSGKTWNKYNNCQPVIYTNNSRLFVEVYDNTPLGDVVEQLMNTIQERVTELDLRGRGLTSPKLGIHTSLPHLKVLNIGGNELREINEGLEELQFLLTLDISNNPLQNIPSGVFKLKTLRVLRASNIILEHLPDDIGCLDHLEVLDIAGHNLPFLPTALEQCGELVELNLSGMPWITNREHLDRSTFINEYINTRHARKKYDQGLLGLYDSLVKKTSTQTLRAEAIEELNQSLFEFFHRLDKAEDKRHPVSNIVTKLTGLKSLNLSFLPITSIPSEITSLKELTKLDLSHNRKLTTVPPELCILSRLSVLVLDSCPSLQVPPKDIVQKGTPAVLLYLRGLLRGSVKCRRTKLMLIGHGGAGKTSLLRVLTGDAEPLETSLTDGINIRELVLRPEGGEDITYNAWDFAGQTVYYNTHQFFLSSRAVYLLLWNVRQGHEYAGLEFWLSSVTCHAPKAKIIVVGTHVDEASNVSIPEQEIRRKFKQVEAFFTVSSKTMVGIPALKEALINITLKEHYMNEEMPKVWLDLEQEILDIRRKQTNLYLLSWGQMRELGAKHYIDNTELSEAVEFLHNLGTVQYFSKHLLKSQVVINPQWIVDVMKCVVSVRGDIIKDGRFEHNDMAKVWRDYPEKLHQWLLRLTESFDLTFPLPGADTNLVPCLMSLDIPEFEWSEEDGEPETRILYRFGYLPAGLFNRLQVRLYQFCDSTVVWKRGCLLRKSNLKALLKQEG